MLGSESHVPMVSAPFIAALSGMYQLTAADVATGQPYEGLLAGTFIYGFTEQIFDVATGLPIAAQPGRTSAFNSGKPTPPYAIERNNYAVPGFYQFLPAKWTSPVPSPLKPSDSTCALYVEMRLLGVVNGAPVYTFSLPPANYALVRLNVGATAQTITLPGGGTLKGFAGATQYVSIPTAGSPPGNCWIIDANQQGSTGTTTLATQCIYQAQQVGVDNAGLTIWAVSQVDASQNNSGIVNMTSGQFLGRGAKSFRANGANPNQIDIHCDQQAQTGYTGPEIRFASSTGAEIFLDADLPTSGQQGLYLSNASGSVVYGVGNTPGVLADSFVAAGKTIAVKGGLVTGIAATVPPPFTGTLGG